MSGLIKKFNDENFDEGISSGVVLVDFYADWCGPCRMIAPILEELAEELDVKVTIAKVDIDEAQTVTSSYQVTSVPTLLLFHNGEVVDQVVGVRDKETLKSMVTAVQ